MTTPTGSEAQAWICGSGGPRRVGGHRPNRTISDEPPPHKLWAAMKTRFRKGGLMVFVLTALEDAAWIDDELEIPERIGKDVFVTVMDTEDSCIEHGVRGHLHHADIEAMFKDFDEAELRARKGGEYLHLAGKIYKTYRADHGGHCPLEIHDYHQDEWEKGRFTLYNVMDPHDRKPFALGWYAVFKNGDIYTVAEWPDDSWPPFHKIKDCPYVPKDYAKIIMETEDALGMKDAGLRGRIVRIIDPNFGNTPSFATKTTIKMDMVKEGQLLGYPVSALGDPLEAVCARLPACMPLRVLSDTRRRIVQVAGVPLPGWTGGEGFHVWDGEAWVVAKAKTLQRPKPWVPMVLRGRWVGDGWGTSWLEVEEIQTLL